MKPRVWFCLLWTFLPPPLLAQSSTPAPPWTEPVLIRVHQGATRASFPLYRISFGPISGPQDARFRDPEVMLRRPRRFVPASPQSQRRQ